MFLNLFFGIFVPLLAKWIVDRYFSEVHQADEAAAVIETAFYAAPLPIVIIVHLFRTIKKQRDEARAERDSLRIKTMPHITYKGWANQQETIFASSGRVVGQPYFAHLIFANDLPIVGITSTAERVVGYIEFWEAPGDTKLFDMLARWVETPEPAQAGAMIMEYTPIDLDANALPRRLDTVLKYKDEAVCYGHNNAAKRTPDWKHGPYKLDAGTYRIKVTLRGKNMGPISYWFRLTNPGKDQNVTVSVT